MGFRLTGSSEIVLRLLRLRSYLLIIPLGRKFDYGVHFYCGNGARELHKGIA